LPILTGVAAGAEGNAAYAASGLLNAAGDQNIGIDFNGGPGVDDIQAIFTTSQDVAYFSHDAANSIPAGATANAGVISIADQLTVSFEGLAPISVVGVGGSLLLDATATPGTTILTIDDDINAPAPLAVPAAAANGVTAVFGDGGWETVQFAGFADVTVRSGTGSETIFLVAIDNAAAPGDLITDIILDGDDAFNTDVGNDTLQVQTLPAGVTATLLGGQDSGAFPGDTFALQTSRSTPTPLARQ